MQVRWQKVEIKADGMEAVPEIGGGSEKSISSLDDVFASSTTPIHSNDTYSAGYTA